MALRRLSLVQSAALILPVVPVLYGFCDDACLESPELRFVRD